MTYILVLTFAIVIGTISYGLVKRYKEDMGGTQKIRKALRINLAVFVPVVAAALIMMVPGIARAAEATSTSSASGLGLIAAGLCTGLAAIGAGYAVGAVGSSALGAISEDPKMLGKTLIYVGLAEGIVIYGLIISIIILARI